MPIEVIVTTAVESNNTVVREIFMVAREGVFMFMPDDRGKGQTCGDE